MGGLATIDLLQANRSELLDDVLIRVCNILQLSPTQFSLAESHYHAICDWLGHEDSELNRFDPDLYPQGSFALGTTVKPQIGDEYDVDLVCELNVNHRSLPRPVLLLDLIEKRMRQSDRYRDRLERMKRCLRVNYEHAFHLDILPACPDPGAGSTCLVIPDREDLSWQASNPKGFVSWFKQKGALRPSVSFAQKAMDSAAPLPQPQTVEQKNPLQLSVQLFKRWRDRNYADAVDLAPVSIVLTTLMGDHYYGEQSVSSNLAFSVKAILDSLPSYGRLIVVNPSHPQEELSERWKDPAKYLAFVSGLKVFKKKLTDLANAEDMGRQSALLQDMFGDSVTKVAFAEQGRSIQKVRDAKNMGIARTAGGIVSLSSTASTPVPRNTFYGDL
jgi:hypothetical protein